MSKTCPSGKILNPLTGRCVKINGKIGKKLMKVPTSPKPIKSKKKGKKVTFNIKKSPKISPKSPKPVKSIAPRLPRGEVGRRAKIWYANKPTSAKERKEVKDKCGDDCFLIPELSKYPVCKKDCELDCDGLRAARNITYLINNRHTVSQEAKDRSLRARKKANEIGVEKCGWKMSK